jgi:Zn-dependent metalloprotease
MNRRCDTRASFLPPYILERLLEASDPEVRRLARASIEADTEARTMRFVLSALPPLTAVPSPKRKKHRLVYDMRNRSAALLPGRLVRSEGEKAVKDHAVNEAYAGTGHIYDFFRRVFGRNSLDGRGMSLISSVHVGRKYNNAFWNGQQMAFGDGDGRIFRRFTRSLDVIGHELAHGLITHTANLTYQGESGALNEHFADVFGVLVRQWRRDETAGRAVWTVGSEIMGPAVEARGLRTFKAERAFQDDPLLGTDPQPKHMEGFYRGSADRGGVHINSGIPNHAFYRTARTIGGRAWKRAGKIWYEALLRLGPEANFAAAATMTFQVAKEIFPRSRKTPAAVAGGWRSVGVEVRER